MLPPRIESGRSIDRPLAIHTSDIGRERPSGRSDPTIRKVHLNRLLSKRGVLTRSEANAAILAGRVAVNGHIVRDPAKPVDPTSSRIQLDGQATAARAWRTILFHKPRGVLTTRRDPEGRTTVYDVLGDVATGLVPVGRLDQATSGLLVLTSDTKLADQITDPGNGISRVYVASVRGRVTPEICRKLEDGIDDGGERLRAESVMLRKTSERESHLVVTLREGKNREIRRLFEAIGHQVTRLKRVAFGALTLGGLAPGAWREVTESEIRNAFSRVVRAERPTAASARRATAPKKARYESRGTGRERPSGRSDVERSEDRPLPTHKRDRKSKV